MTVTCFIFKPLFVNMNKQQNLLRSFSPRPSVKWINVNFRHKAIRKKKDSCTRTCHHPDDALPLQPYAGASFEMPIFAKPSSKTSVENCATPSTQDPNRAAPLNLAYRRVSLAHRADRK